MREPTMTRRSFVKAATVAGAAAALGTQAAGSLIAADKAWAETPSDAKMYVSTCHGCIQVCPCRVYVKDNIVVKLEGHPIAPANLGGMCLKGLSQLHTVYSPRRVLYPLKRSGPRGAEEGAWERISWDEAIELAASRIFEAAEKYGTYSFFTSTGGGGGYSFEQTRTLATALGGPNVIEPGCAQCYLPRVAMADLMYSGQNQSIADCSNQEFHKGLSPYEAAKGVTQDTKSLVVWGAQPSVSQTAQSGRGCADLREAGCKVVVVDPNMSPDAVKADVWIRIRPHSDSAMVLSWWRYIIENKLYDEAFTKAWTNLPFIVNPDTHLPFLATDIWPDYEQGTPADTPAYVCFDTRTGEIQPFEYQSNDVDPEIFWSGTVDGKACRSAGQIYKDAAEPYTLEKAEELCWVPANIIEAGIKIYAEAEVSGISNGVATDMEQNASQVPTGLLGLDMIMGYVNKPGATLTQHTRPMWDPKVDDYVLEPGQTPDIPGPRPTYKPNGSFFTQYGFGWEIGATQEANEARIAAIPDTFEPSKEPPPAPQFMNQRSLYLHNQMKLDQLGMKNHKGLYHWNHSHIPSVLEAITTGVPYKPRVWYDFSGNKMAVIGNAGSWYNAFKEIDFCICQYPMITSFQAEVADLIFPLSEWLENPIASRFQLNYVFPQTQVIHLGETVSSAVPPQKVQNATAKKLNDHLASGGEIVFGAIGAAVGPGESGPASPSAVSTSPDEQQTSNNATAMHPFDANKYPLEFPIGAGVLGTVEEDAVVLDQMWKRFGASSYEEFLNDPSFQGPDPLDPTNPRFVIDPEIFWQYGQHEWEALDGLPRGFGTESRKCEVYVTALIKMAANGWPYCYPRVQEPVDASIGQEVVNNAAVDVEYPYVGSYSPICWHFECAESPIEGYPGYDPEYPLSLTSGRLHYFHHGTMRHAPFIRELYPVPYVRMHPDTAAEYGLEHLDWVKVTSRRNSTHGRVYITRSMHPKVLWMERFWNPELFDNSQTQKTGGWAEMNVNVLTKNSAPYNEVFGSYTNRGFQVKIEKGERPRGVWVEPHEFEPFLPSNVNQYTPEDGAGHTWPQTPNVTFNDWDRGGA